jgi:ribokinase
MTAEPITFLAIGDIVVDAFIELSDAHITCNINNSNCEICMRFGDKIPFANDYILYGVGNSPNASVSAARLGLQSSLLTHLGSDTNGSSSLESLRSNNVDTSHCHIEDGVKTNYHYVLWYRPERTILVKHEHYTYDFGREADEIRQKPDWVYLSSIGGGTEQYHNDIGDWLIANPEIKCAFQPGTFQMNLGVEKLSNIYARSELFFCNVEEALRITGGFSDFDESTWQRGTDKFYRALVDMCMWIQQHGPRVVVITDGPNGAYSFNGTHELYCPMYPDPAPPLERTGAGDAYASTFTAFYAQGYSIIDCMLRAPINSMNVVQHIGAQQGLLSLPEIEQFLSQAPETYKVTTL